MLYLGISNGHLKFQVKSEMQSYENNVRALFMFTKLQKYHTIENKMKTSIRYCWTVFLINLQIEKYPISTKLIPI